MITYSFKDYNIKNIVEKTGLLGKPLWGEYRIYGLSNDSLTDMVISFDSDNYSSLDDKFWQLIELFEINNFITVGNEMNFDNNNICKIGLRKDLRANTKLCSCIVRTVIGVAESQLILNDAVMTVKFKK